MGQEKLNSLHFFGEYLSSAQRYDQRFPNPSLNNAYIVNRLLVGYPVFKEWLIDHDGKISEDAIKRGVNIILRTYFGQNQDIDIDEVYALDDKCTNGENLEYLKLAYQGVEADLQETGGEKFRKIIEQSYPVVLDMLAGNEDLREPLLCTPSLNCDDLEAYLAASAMCVMAERMQEVASKYEDINNLRSVN